MYLAAKRGPRAVPDPRRRAGAPLPVAALKPTLLGLQCDELSRGGAGEAGDHIPFSDRRGATGCGCLAALASLARAIKKPSEPAASASGELAADLLWLVMAAATTVQRIRAHALQRTWSRPGPPTTSTLSGGSGGLDARLLPSVLVRGRRWRKIGARPPRAAVLVLRVGVGGAATPRVS